MSEYDTVNLDDSPKIRIKCQPPKSAAGRIRSKFMPKTLGNEAISP